MVENEDKLTAIFLVHNEEKSISFSISAAHPFVDQTLIVDMESTDRTVEIAKSLNAKIIQHKNVANFDIGRLAGIDQCQTEWVILLDADEIVTKKLMEAILEIIRSDSADFIYLPWANYAWGGVVLNEGGFPEYHPRCFKKTFFDRASYNGQIHKKFEPLKHARTHYIQGAYPDFAVHHLTNVTISTFINKMNKYTTVEAADRLTQPRLRKTKIITRPIKIFIRHYILNKGYRDGWRGLGLSLTFAYIEILINLKICEADEHGGIIPNDSKAREKMLEMVPK